MNPLKEALKLLNLLVAVLLLGTFGYHVIEGWKLFDALYTSYSS
jgi:hypothetical protein